MATDFTYGKKQILSSGPFRPSGKDMPNDARTRVEVFADIALIPTPFVGMKITVLVDETNNNKMTDYIVKSLKANSAGIANMLIDEVVRYVDYLGVSGGSSGGGSGEGLTSEQIQQLQTAYEHSQSKHVSMEEVNEAISNAQLGGGEVDLSTYATKTYTDNAVSTALDGHTFKFLTQEEYDVLPDEEKNNPTIEYHITDSNNSENIDTTNLASDLSLSGLTLQLKNSQGNLIGNAITLPSTSGGSSSGGSGISYTSVDVSTDTFVICKPGFVLSSTSATINEGSSTTFTVKLEEAPSEDITITLTSSNENVTVSPSTLTFTSSNYNATQTVTVNTVEASDYIDWSANIIVSSVGYNKATFTVNCKNISVNYGNIITSLSSLTIIEGKSGTFTVKLGSQPTQNQTVSLSSNNTDVTLSPSTLTFAPSNYDTAQIVTVTIVEDSDGTNDSATITLSSSNVSNVTVNVKKAVVEPMIWHFDAQQQDNSQRTSMFGLSDLNGSDIVIKNTLYSAGAGRQALYDIESHWADGAYIINDGTATCLHKDLVTLSPLFDKDFTVQMNYLKIDDGGGSVLWLGTYDNYRNCLNIRTNKVRIGDGELNTSTLPTAEQIQVIMAYKKSTNSMKIWVNGSKEYDSVLPTTLDTQQSFGIGIGRLGGSANIKVYSLRIYNYVISDEVASELYTTESAIEGRA